MIADVSANAQSGLYSNMIDGIDNNDRRHGVDPDIQEAWVTAEMGRTGCFEWNLAVQRGIGWERCWRGAPGTPCVTAAERPRDGIRMRVSS